MTASAEPRATRLLIRDAAIVTSDDAATVHDRGWVLVRGDVGRPAVGFAADLQLVDLSLPTPPAAHNLYEQLLLWRSGARPTGRRGPLPPDVTDVMVVGSWRVRDRELIGVDLPRLRARVREQAERLWTTA